MNFKEKICRLIMLFWYILIIPTLVGLHLLLVSGFTSSQNIPAEYSTCVNIELIDQNSVWLNFHLSGVLTPTFITIADSGWRFLAHNVSSQHGIECRLRVSRNIEALFCWRCPISHFSKERRWASSNCLSADFDLATVQKCYSSRPEQSFGLVTYGECFSFFGRQALSEKLKLPTLS